MDDFKCNFYFWSALQALLKKFVVCRLVRFLIVLTKCVGYLTSLPFILFGLVNFNFG